MVLPFSTETRLTAKELPTSKWRRERRVRAGEYTHTNVGNNSNNVLSTNASPPCSPGSALPPTGQRVHFYPHTTTRYTPLHYPAVVTPPALHPMQTNNSVGGLIGNLPTSSISSPSPSPTSSTSSSSQTPLMMTANMRLGATASHMPPVHYATHTSMGSPHSPEHEQNLERPLDMTVSSALLNKRNSPPPPYREPLPGSSYITALARPSVITQAPPKRRETDNNTASQNNSNNNNNDNGHQSVQINESNVGNSSVVLTQNNEADTLCENVIDEHFRRSLGANYLALFADNAVTENDVQPTPLKLTINKPATPPPPAPPNTTTTTTPPVIEEATTTATPSVSGTTSPLELTASATTTTTPPPPTVATTMSTIDVAQGLVLHKKRAQPPPLASDMPIKLTVQQTLSPTLTTTPPLATPTPTPTQPPAVYMDVDDNELKRYGKHKAAYLKQKNFALYKQQETSTTPEPTATTPTPTPTTTTTTATTTPPTTPTNVACNSSGSNLLKEQDKQNKLSKIVTHAPLPLVRNKSKKSSLTTAETTNECNVSSPPITISHETDDVLASVDDHFAKALGDKWKELQGDNLQK